MAAREHGDAVADVRRDQMLAAAATLIAERGFHDTRIADVAKRVGASPALVIYYFGTKDSLLTEALRWSERSFYVATEEMLRSTDKLRDRLEILVEWTLVADKTESVTGDWGLWFDLWAQAFRHPEVKKDRAELDAQWRDLIARIVQDGVDAGEIAAPRRRVVRDHVGLPARRPGGPGRSRRPGRRPRPAPARWRWGWPTRSSGSTPGATRGKNGKSAKAGKGAKGKKVRTS